MLKVSIFKFWISNVECRNRLNFVTLCLIARCVRFFFSFSIEKIYLRCFFLYRCSLYWQTLNLPFDDFAISSVPSVHCCNSLHLLYFSSLIMIFVRNDIEWMNLKMNVFQMMISNTALLFEFIRTVTVFHKIFCLQSFSF